MTGVAFQKLITNITVVLNNYLQIAKQSGRIVIMVDAISGEPTKVSIGNTLELNIEELKNAKEGATVQS